MLNKALLSSKMALNCDTGKTLSLSMGISQQAFSQKLNEKDGKEFGKSEIMFFIERYHLKAKEVMDIFFATEVSEKDTCTEEGE